MNANKSITVLYVDDEDINLFLFNATFRNKYKIITASSGKQGLEKLGEQHHEIIVVISDMKMPQMDGLTFIQNAKAKHFNIAYFILTAFEYDERIEMALKTNLIQKFFTKPFNAAEIEAAIDQAAEQITTES